MWKKYVIPKCRNLHTLHVGCCCCLSACLPPQLCTAPHVLIHCSCVCVCRVYSILWLLRYRIYTVQKWMVLHGVSFSRTSIVHTCISRIAPSWMRPHRHFSICVNMCVCVWRCKISHRNDLQPWIFYMGFYFIFVFSIRLQSATCRLYWSANNKNNNNYNNIHTFYALRSIIYYFRHG